MLTKTVRSLSLAVKVLFAGCISLSDPSEVAQGEQTLPEVFPEERGLYFLVTDAQQDRPWPPGRLPVRAIYTDEREATAPTLRAQIAFDVKELGVRHVSLIADEARGAEAISNRPSSLPVTGCRPALAMKKD